MDAIKIKKLDDESAKEIANDSDEVDYKKVFEKAMNSFSDGDLDSTVKCLDEIKIENVDLSQLTSDIRKRIELNKSFELFKEEFLDTETK